MRHRLRHALRAFVRAWAGSNSGVRVRREVRSISAWTPDGAHEYRWSHTPGVVALLAAQGAPPASTPPAAQVVPAVAVAPAPVAPSSTGEATAIVPVAALEALRDVLLDVAGCTGAERDGLLVSALGRVFALLHPRAARPRPAAHQARTRGADGVEAVDA
jgi:hypothetical protein